MKLTLLVPIQTSDDGERCSESCVLRIDNDGWDEKCALTQPGNLVWDPGTGPEDAGYLRTDTCKRMAKETEPT